MTLFGKASTVQTMTVRIEPLEQIVLVDGFVKERKDWIHWKDSKAL